MSYANGAKGLKQKIAQQKLDVKLKSLTDTQREAARQHWTNWADETGALNCDCESCKIAIAVHAEDEQVKAEEQEKLKAVEAAKAKPSAALAYKNFTTDESGHKWHTHYSSHHQPETNVYTVYTIDQQPALPTKYIQRVVDKLALGNANIEIAWPAGGSTTSPSMIITVTIDGD
jgi:hypothetical protein